MYNAWPKCVERFGVMCLVQLCCAGLNVESALEGLGSGVLGFGRLVGLLLAGLLSALVVAVRRPRGG